MLSFIAKAKRINGKSLAKDLENLTKQIENREKSALDRFQPVGTGYNWRRLEQTVRMGVTSG